MSFLKRTNSSYISVLCEIYQNRLVFKCVEMGIQHKLSVVCSVPVMIVNRNGLKKIKGTIGLLTLKK